MCPKNLSFYNEAQRVNIGENMLSSKKLTFTKIFQKNIDSIFNPSPSTIAFQTKPRKN
jgi:hypothetical protein